MACVLAPCLCGQTEQERHGLFPAREPDWFAGSGWREECLQQTVQPAQWPILPESTNLTRSFARVDALYGALRHCEISEVLYEV